MFKKSLIAAAAIASVVASPFAVSAGTDLGRIGDTWFSLSINDKNVCFAYAEYDGGVGLGFSLTTDGSDVWRVVLAKEEWKFIEKKPYTVTVSIDDKPFSLNMEALSEKSLIVEVNKEFMHHFTSGHGLTIYGSTGVVLGKLSLKGTTQAVTASAQCTKAVMQAQNSSPFGVPKETAPAPRNSTPFASAGERGA